MTMIDNKTTERLIAMLEERGVEYKTHGFITGKAVTWRGNVCDWVALPDESGLAVGVYKNYLTPEQAIAATLGRPKARSHPYGYERDTGAYDCTRCECGCINDISATYCNDCGGEIEIDESAEKEYYDGYSKHTVFAKKLDDGSLEFCERRYVPEDTVTLRNEKLGQDVDSVYREQIAPRVRKKNSPTAAIREWSILTHSVMELTGPSPFGMNGNIELWLHESSLTLLLDMCDEVDKKFEMLNSGTLTAKQVWEAIEEAEAELLKRCEHVGDMVQRQDDVLKAFGKMKWTIADELGSEECEWTLKEEWPNRSGDDHVYGYETSCGARHTWWPDSLPNFCPTCGGRVKAMK